VADVDAVIGLLHDIYDVADAAKKDRSVYKRLERARKVASYYNGVYKDSWVWAHGAGRSLFENVLSYRIALYSWLGITSLWYLSRQGFTQILDYLPSAEENGVLRNMMDLTRDPEKCLSSLENIVESTDTYGYPASIMLDVSDACGKLRSWPAVVALLGAAVYEMTLNETVPSTTRYPITPFAVELAGNIINWSKGSMSLSYYTIEGPLGCGKSTFLYYSILGALRIITGAPPVEFENRLWSLLGVRRVEELIEVLRYYSKLPEEVYVPILVVEDASHVLPKYWVWRGKQFVEKMQELHDLLVNLRSRTANLVFIANSVDSLASFVREMATIRLRPFDRSVGAVKHTVFYHAVGNRDLLLKGLRALRIYGAVAYPLVRLPDEIYELDRRSKNAAIARITDKLAAG